MVRKVAAQLFDDLAGIHEWSIVHRDVKGSNLLFCDRERRFKLIDFGAACDVVSRINYSESLQPFDPKHCPPEAPPAEGGLVLRSGGRFDVFSAGLLLVQMCFPPHRSDDGIVAFKRSLAQQHEWKLQAWRESVEGSAAYDPGFRLLDRNGGWELLRRCLKRRPGDRISSAKAAASGFCRA